MAGFQIALDAIPLIERRVAVERAGVDTGSSQGFYLVDLRAASISYRHSVIGETGGQSNTIKLSNGETTMVTSRDSPLARLIPFSLRRATRLVWTYYSLP